MNYFFRVYCVKPQNVQKLHKKNVNLLALQIVVPSLMLISIQTLTLVVDSRVFNRTKRESMTKSKVHYSHIVTVSIILTSI